jgi:acyl-CoA thioesterase FadM
MQAEALTPWIETAPFEVRYAETDAMGVVYYANYLVWFEAARGSVSVARMTSIMSRWRRAARRWQWWKRTAATARPLAMATR